MSKQNKLTQINKLINSAHVSLENARQLLSTLVDKGAVDATSTAAEDKAKEIGSIHVEGNEKIVEGIFDGQNMFGPDGKQYSIPANYASKSKLVCGDTLKLTIMPDGTFLYKQIGPVDRNRLVGVLAKDDTTDEYRVIVGDKIFKVLLASITYFKGEAGDEVVILVPKEKECEWAAVENIIKIPGEAEKLKAEADRQDELEKKTVEGEVEDIEEIS
ncbi:MAG: hypothetical protein Q8P20_01950 [bacterium]|nr:hypothetical protein [bacterium]